MKQTASDANLSQPVGSVGHCKVHSWPRWSAFLIKAPPLQPTIGTAAMLSPHPQCDLPHWPAWTKRQLAAQSLQPWPMTRVHPPFAKTRHTSEPDSNAPWHWRDVTPHCASERFVLLATSYIERTIPPGARGWPHWLQHWLVQMRGEPPRSYPSACEYRPGPFASRRSRSHQ